MSQRQTETQAPPVLPAIGLVLCAVVLFSRSDVLAKLLRQSLPAVEIAWLGYIVFVAFGTVLAGRNRFAGLRPRRPVLQGLRGLGLVASAVLTALVPFGFVLPTPGQAGITLALGVCASVGQYLVITAYRRVPASMLAPFSYAQILSSTGLGYLVFGAVPDRATLVGAAIVIASGLYTAHRERVRVLERRASASKK